MKKEVGKVRGKEKSPSKMKNNLLGRHPPHTAIDVRVGDGKIPVTIFYVFTIFDITPNKAYFKKFDSFKQAELYVMQYKDTIAGRMIIKEYVDRDCLEIVV